MTNREEYAEYRIALIGDRSVGKSSIVECFRNNKIDPFQRNTIGVDCSPLVIFNGNLAVKLQLFDCSGDPKFREYCSTAFSNVKGIIFVYDVSRSESFENLRDVWLQVLEKFVAENNICPIFVVANKIDLKSEERSVKSEDGKRFAVAQSASSFHETSAKTGAGIQELFQEVASTMTTTWGGVCEIVDAETKQAIKKEKKKKKRKTLKFLKNFTCCSCCSCCGKQKPASITHENVPFEIGPKNGEAKKKTEDEDEEEGEEPEPDGAEHRETSAKTSKDLEEEEQLDPLNVVNVTTSC